MTLSPGVPVPKPAPRKKRRPKPMARKSTRKRTPPPMAGKPTRVRDEEHLERVRAMWCSAAARGREDQCGGWESPIHGGRHPSEAAHVTNRGWGGGDDTVIPLCPNHHRLLACSWHVAGRKRFEKTFGFNVAALARRLYDETLRLRGKQTP